MEENNVCPICKKVFSRPFHLARHVSTVHTHEHPYKCPKCDLKFKRKDSLKRHVAEHHLRRLRNPKKGKLISRTSHFECLSCGTEFTTSRALRNHIDLMHSKKSAQPSRPSDSDHDDWEVVGDDHVSQTSNDDEQISDGSNDEEADSLRVQVDADELKYDSSNDSISEISNDDSEVNTSLEISDESMDTSVTSLVETSTESDIGDENENQSQIFPLDPVDFNPNLLDEEEHAYASIFSRP